MPNNAIRRLVIDLLKPLESSLIDISKSLSIIEGINGVNLVVYEMDRKTETLKATIEGDDINFEKVKKTLDEFGVVLHSLDEVAAGKILIEESQILSDKHSLKRLK